MKPSSLRSAAKERVSAQRYIQSMLSNPHRSKSSNDVVEFHVDHTAGGETTDRCLQQCFNHRKGTHACSEQPAGSRKICSAPE